MKRRECFGSSFGMLAASAVPQERSRQFPNVPGLTKYVSEFIASTKYRDIPEDVLALGRKSILDGFGLALAGSVSLMGRLIRQYVEKFVAPGSKSSIVGTGMKVPTRFAALANGVFIHADDYDDTQLSVAPDRVYGLLTHPTVPVLPSVFALAETNRYTGEDLTLAYHVGVEVECKIAEAISPRHYGAGFHSTGTLGSFGGAAACAKLLKLDTKRIANALGIAGAQAAGLRSNFGSMTKPFTAGHAAENGAVAADLASIGWTASEEILEAKEGWFSAAGGGFDPEAIMNRLGKPWTFADPGVSIKPFPSGSLTHPAMGEMLRLARENNVQAANVDKVDMGGNSAMMAALIHHRPENSLQAKFSMEFCMAVLLLDRKAGLTEFTDPVVRRPDVQQLLRRGNFFLDPEAEKTGLNKKTSNIKNYMKDGKNNARRPEVAKRDPAHPISYQKQGDQIRGCAEFAKWPSAKAESVIQIVRTLEQATDVSKISAALTS